MDEAGDCFKVAGRLCLDKGYELCHGQPVATGGPAEGQRIWHAWCEYTDEHGIRWVVDQSNGRDHLLPQDFYYKVGRLDRRWVTTYDRAEASALMLFTDHWGPWGEDSHPPTKED